jgi:hypothetical protein
MTADNSEEVLNEFKFLTQSEVGDLTISFSVLDSDLCSSGTYRSGPVCFKFERGFEIGKLINFCTSSRSKILLFPFFS